MDNDKKIFEEILAQRKAVPPKTMAEFMATVKGDVVLYGAGAFGRENLERFKKYGVNPVMFLDRSVEVGTNREVEGVKVFNPDDPRLDENFRKSCHVYVAITLPKKIMDAVKNSLRDWGYSNVEEVQHVAARIMPFEGVADENPSDGYIESQLEKIISVFKLMADDESRKSYISCVRAHLLRDYVGAYITDFPCQYFDAGVPLMKDFSNFVDCGAYNGDSLETCLKYCDKIENYMGFEPVTSNFSALSKKADALKDKINHAYLYPCGISDFTGNAHFNVAASSSAMSTGGEVLPIVKLDDVLKNVPVTFLKMDIEGAEPGALRGAENLIKNFAPDLAISVYHAANHYWDIPLMIREMNPDYKFFLRTHTPATLESVLYCTI